MSPKLRHRPAAAQRQPLAPRRHPLALAIAIALAAPVAPAWAQALPTGASVVRGQATIATQGSRMTVGTSNQAVLNWQSFSIGADQSVRFEQPTASSKVLNRVIGRDPSHILGQLSSNGEVWLINPYGVMFGQGARVDVAGLVASTLNISDADFAARRFSLLGNGSEGTLVNQGAIRTPFGGRVLLVGGQAGVRNEGLIEAPGGQVALAAGASVDLADAHSPQLAVRVTAPAGRSVNLGQILAPGGVVDLSAAMVNQDGIVRADSLSHGPGGEVRLTATDTLTLGPDSRTSANGDRGGRVTLHGHTTLVAGAVQALGSEGVGGDLRALGTQVGLLDGAQLDASGSAGGGSIRVGGGEQGRESGVPNARAIFMAPGAALHADATAHGDGGRVVLWSDNATRAYGSISARGGAAGGDGGFIETSGGWLDARPVSIRTEAPKGRPGQWLLDPNDILISDGSVLDTHITAGPDFRTTNDSAIVTIGSIAAALAGGSSVTVSTGTAAPSSQPGDILMQGSLTVVPPNAATLTLNAHRHITLDGAGIDSSGPLSVNLSAGGGGQGGIVIQNSTVTIGGNLTLGGSALACGAAGCAPFAAATAVAAAGHASGVSISSSSLTAGRVQIRGASALADRGHFGVSIDSGTLIEAQQIDISGWVGSPANFGQVGVDVAGTLAAVDRLSIDGTSRINGPGGVESSGIGVRIGSFGSLLVGPDAVSSRFTGFGDTVQPLANDRRALAADPNRSLSIIGASDVRSGLFTPSIDLSGQVLVTNKAGVGLTGNGGELLLRSNSFDLDAAGNLLSSGSGMLVIRTDDAVLPSAEPVRLSNTAGVRVQGTMFGTPSEFTIDSPAGAVVIDDFFLSPSINIGSAPFSSRSATFAMGLSSPSTGLHAGTALIRSGRIELGPSASITASGSGDAIVLAGLAGNVGTLLVDPDTSPLSTPNGHWLVYATDPADAANFAPGALQRDFTQYNATYPGSTVLGTGNGMLFSRAPEALLSGIVTGQTSKTYDGSTASSAQLTQASVTGLLPGDVAGPVSVGALRYATPNVGSGIPLLASVAGGVPAIHDANNRPVFGYLFNGRTANVFGSIVQRGVALEGLGTFDKVYDGTTSVPLQGVRLAGLVPGENLTVQAGTVAFDNANAGRNKPVSGQLVIADGPGGLAGNYSLQGGAQVSTTATISPRPVTLTGAVVADKVYDGSAAATVSGATLTGLVGTQTLGVNTGAASFDTPDAGTDKPVTASLQLTDGSNGGQAANYLLTNGSALALTGRILPRPLQLPDIRISDKFYDGTTAAQTSVGALVGTVPGEALNLVVDARFADSQAGAGKAVGIAASLADTASGRAANYTLGSAGQGRASILPRPVTVGGVFAFDKPYDGTTTAALGAATFAGVVPGETLTLAAQASFSSPSVGTAKSVSGTIALADGSARAANYELTNGGAFSGQAAITPRGLIVTAASAGSKVYDGNASIGVTGFTLAGVLPGEQVSVAGGTGRFDDPDVGSGKAVTATATGLAGTHAANYALTQPTVRTAGTIDPAVLTYTADRLSSTVGYPLPPLTGTLSGFVPGDSAATSTSGQLRFDTAATPTSPVGSYAVVGSGLGARNYVFAQAAGNASALTLVPLSTSKVAEPTSTAPGVPQLLAALQPTPVVTSIGAHRALDALPAMQFAPPNFVFQPFDLEGSSQQDVARMLAARDRYKKGIFADAIRELEANPGAADAPACQTVEQAIVGSCLVTEVLKRALRERVQIEFRRAEPPATAPGPVAAAPPAAPPAAAAAPATPAPPPPAPTPAPAPAPAAAIAPQPKTPLAAVEPVFRLPAARAVRSATLPQIQTKWALLIGTDVYADQRIPQLDNAVADVEAVAQVLEGKLGYQTVVVRNGSKAAILRAFNQLAAAVAPTDSVAIYYAGHGELLEKLGLGFWQPSDADASRAETWISNTDIGKLLGQITASQVVLVSDSCFSGSLVSDDRIRGGGAAPDAAALLSRRAAVVMSSGGNEPVFDSGKNGHSTFAWSFMRALDGVASWRPGGNLFEQVRFAVARQVPQRPQYGASRLGGHQPGADYVFEQRQLESTPK